MVDWLGYRPPLSDGSIGPEGDPADHIDVYLADLGRKGIYGYCTSDQPDGDATRQVYGYCVLDNDYAHTQFPVHNKLQNLQVTAAHEFFHLVQFGYDWWEVGVTGAISALIVVRHAANIRRLVTRREHAV